MSGTIFMNKLMEGVSVEWTTLGDEFFLEVANAARRPVKASLRVSGMVPYYGANNIQDYVDGHTHDGEYVLIAEDGSASPENYSVQYATGKFWANNHVHVVRGKEGLNTRFLYHYLCAVDFIPYLPNKDRSKLTKGEMIKIPLPIPCPDNPKKSLEIQAEIARILDTFTELTAELTGELTARKQQYEYYRDALLSFGDRAEERTTITTLGEIFNMRAGRNISASNISSVPSGRRIYPCFGGNGVRGFVEDFSHDDKHVLIGRQGALCGNVQRVQGKFFATEHAVVVKANGEVNLDWAYHLLTHINLNQYASKSAQPGLAVGTLAKVKVAVPPIKVQIRIAGILDRFDKLTSSMSEGLPREIELRQKQFAYYRDRLFSFPMPDTANTATVA